MKSRISQRLGLASAALLLALLLSEAACRFLAPARPSMRFQQDVAELEGLQLHAATRIIRNDPELFWRLVPNTRLPADMWPFFGRIANGQSLREDHDITPVKRENEIRILFLGDSCTFGYGVAYDQAFPQIVETTLRAAHPAIPIEAINAGVPGYSIFQGWRYLVTEGRRYSPDVVVLNFGWNDYATWDHRSDHDHYADMQASTPPGILRSSRLAQWLWAARSSASKDAAGSSRRPRVLPDEFATVLRSIETMAEAGDFKLLVLVWPMRGNTNPGNPPDMRTQLQEQMIAFGQRSQVTVPPHAAGALDLVPLARELVGKHGVEAVYFDNGHVTPLAHQAFAEAIAEKIEPWVAANTEGIPKGAD